MYLNTLFVFSFESTELFWIRLSRVSLIFNCSPSSFHFITSSELTEINSSSTLSTRVHCTNPSPSRWKFRVTGPPLDNINDVCSALWSRLHYVLGIIMVWNVENIQQESPAGPGVHLDSSFFNLIYANLWSAQIPPPPPPTHDPLL